MRDEKRAVYSGHTFKLKNVIPDITDTERRLIIQGIANDLTRVFRRNR